MRLEPLGADRFVIRAGYSNALRAAVGMVGGLKFDYTRKGYVGHGDAIEAVLRLVDGKMSERLVNPEVLTPTVGAPPFEVPEGFRSYQAAGVSWLLSKKAGILADDMGLGKSAQALTAARAVGGRTLIVCFKYVRGVWSGELAKWWPQARVVGLSGSPVKGFSLSNENVVICHYDILPKWLPVIRAWGARTLIVDEAQALSHETSARAKAAKTIAADCPHRFFLTGTPMPNRPRDLWNILDTLHPGRFGSFFTFGMRYCGGHKVEIPEIGKTVYDFDGASNLEELQKRMGWLMFRRSKADVALELPPLTRQIVWVEPTTRKKTPWREGLSRRTIREILNRTADDKLADVVDLAEGHASRGLVVVGCYRRAAAEWVQGQLALRGVDAHLFHGGFPTDKREKIIKEMRALSRGALIVTIDSCATGVDFSWANVGVVAEPTYEPAELLQFESRMHRFGARGESVSIQYICSRGSVDELIVGAVISKLSNFEGALTSQEGSSKFREDLGGAPSGEDILKEIGL